MLRLSPLLLLLCLVLSGCGSLAGGRITTTDVQVDNTVGAEAVAVPVGSARITVPPGASVTVRQNTVQQPANSETPATLTATTPDGTTDANTGHSQLLSAAMGQLGFLPWVGVGFILLGVLLTFAAFRYPPIAKVVPKWGGGIFVALGVGLIALPRVIERYDWVFLLVGLVALLLFAWWVVRRWQAVDREQAEESETLARVMRGVDRVRDLSPALKTQVGGIMREEMDDRHKAVIRKRKGA
jgi:hypothetical protein